MIKVLLCLLVSCGLFCTDDISGYWKTIDDKTGEARSVVAIYENEGFHYGRIIASFDHHGKVKDSIYAPVNRAPGVVGQPFYSGLDIIWYLVDAGNQFKGKILDPEHGKVYNAELWIENGNLVVRGKVMMFGRSQTWIPATAADFPKGFKLPDLKSLVPAIPDIN